MADLASLLAVLEHDPDDHARFEALPEIARQAPAEARASRFAQTRKLLAARGRPDAVVKLLDAELAATDDLDRKIELLLDKGTVLDGDLLDVPDARAAFDEVLALRPDDARAKEAIGELELAASNWQKFAAKYVEEATASTDRTLATGLYLSAAEAYVRFAPASPEAERYLREALDIDPRNAPAAFHLVRLLRRNQRWPELAELLEQRAELAGSVEEKAAALLGLAEVARDRLDDPRRAEIASRRVLQLDPAHPQALRTVTDTLAAAGDWPAVVAIYQAALKARPDDPGIVLQIAMVLWKHVGDLDQAEDYFRRVRRVDPAHPAALDFYRAYYPARGEPQKLMALLRQVEKSSRTRADTARPISLEIAELAEAQHNPEKAIEAWKQLLRHEPDAATSDAGARARAALARLYRQTEKWNALLDLMKEEVERLPEDEIAGRVAKLHEVVEIYRDKLRLDVMVINTYHAILKLDPDNRRATDELAAKFRALGRWNDLIAVLTRKSEAPELAADERIALLREVANLWAERFGNFANAIKPLERILELDPGDDDALGRLKEIYTKRRQWRALIDVLGREASVLAGDDRRAKLVEMAKLAAERLGDTRLAIEIYNQVLAGDGADQADTLASLAALYDREKRWLALAEILHRQVAVADPRDAIALYEKLGQIYADRLGAPQLAAEAWQQVIEREPGHARALRTLRELYAAAGDFTGLEGLYARLGQEDELVEALLAIADRFDAKAQRLPLVERAAQLAQLRADAAAAAGDSGPIAAAAAGEPRRRRRANSQLDPAGQALERARQVWERVLAVEPQHTGAAAALAPIYARQEKWAKLITVLEIELAAAPDDAARLAKLDEIRALCEHKLTSRTLAFTWTLRAFDLDRTGDPAREGVFADVLRLASEPEQWREAAAVFERHAADEAVERDRRLALYRELARIAARRLGDLERARGYHRQVLALEPDDREAEQHLEELAIQLADWPELLASYRRRAAREADPTERATLLNEIATLQEEKLVDLDGAAATHRESLATLPGQLRALRALARIEEARGDGEALAAVLAAELAQTEGAGRVELLMRLGVLEEQLDRPAAALARFRDAFAAGGGARSVPAITRLVLPDTTAIPGADRIAAVRLILPSLEAAADRAALARALEVIRAGDDTAADERVAIDRRLIRIYHVELGDPAAAWTAGLRVIAADPADAETRRALDALAGQLGRDGEWAQHLGAALATLRARPAPTEVRAVATELAKLAGERLGDRPTAERAWLAVLEVEPAAADAFGALGASYRTDQRWSDLRALLERRVDVTVDGRIRRDVLLELAAIEEEVLGDPGRAAAAHRRVLEHDPGYLAAYQALDRLYTAGAQWRELEDVLARWSDQVTDETAQIALAQRRAELFARSLGEPARAVDLAERVIQRQQGHADARELLEELLGRADGGDDALDAALVLRIARVLEPLYEQDRLWRDLVGVLRAQRKRVGGTEAVELLARIAAVEEAELGGAAAAFDAWLEVLGLDPAHERARVELARLAGPLGRWPDAAAAFEAAVAAVPASDLPTRGAVLGELAAYYDHELHDPARAIDAYRRWLDADPSSPHVIRTAGGALARLYDEAGAWPELRAALRKQAEWADDPDHRRALLARIAELEEARLGERDAAIATWNEVILDHPADAGALDALERLYQAAARWRELIDVLRRKLDQAAPGDDRALLRRIADLHEATLGEPDEAIAAHLEAVDRDPSDRAPLAELARLYRAAGRHADLLDVLERQGQLEPARHQELQLEIAGLLAGPLARPLDALERWHDVLGRDPEHPQAIAAIEAALEDPELRMAAADILRPLYAQTQRPDRLAALLLRLAGWADHPAAKLRALDEVVRLREQALGDKPGAFEARLLALRWAATEPELGRVVADTERLAGELGREADLIDAYREVAPNVLDAEIQRRLYLDTADLARAVRRDLVLARDTYEKVLDAQPDDRRALAALDSIYRETNDDDRLVEVLLRQAEAAGGDVEDRVGALVEAAGLYAQLDRADDAIATWEQVLEVAPERRDAVDALEALYRAQGRWPDVVDLYDRRLGFATTIDEAVALRVQLGQIYEQHLRDLETAIDNYAAALGGDPRHAAALGAVERYLGDPDLRGLAAEVLEPIYVAQHRWNDLIRVYEARLDGAGDPAERLRLTRFVARLYEEQLEDFERASHWYAKVFREAPGDPAIRDQLQRLAAIVDNWAFVAETYQGLLDDEPGETPELRDVAIAAAAIYDRRLGDVDAACAAYRRALAIVVDDAFPDDRELVRRVEELLTRAERWPELVAVYDDVVARGDDELRVEVMIKRARTVEHGLGDAERAIEGWREVMVESEGDREAAYREAVSQLERLYRAGGRWRDVVDLYEARLAHADQPAELAELRLQLAEVHEHQLHDVAAALDQHEQVIDAGPGWERAVAALERLVVHDDHRERIAALLEPVYRRQDWWQKLVVILDAKLAYVRDPADQVATLHEIAEIHERRGGALDLALEALARAWRIDVADDDSLARLLALAGKLDAWDQAAMTIEGGAEAAPDPDLAAALWARAAEIHEAHRGDHARAIAAWRRVEQARPDELVALAALDRLLALEGRVEELVAVVQRRADLTEDGSVRLVLLHRAAALLDEVIGDGARAIEAYKTVLAVDDSDLAALDALERLYRANLDERSEASGGGDPAGAAGGAGARPRGIDAGGGEPDARELAHVLERRIEVTADVEARHALRHAAAEVYERRLGDIYQAIGQLTAILDDDAGAEAALAELDRIYGANKLWPELLDVIDRRALLAPAAADRAELAFRAARLVETELHDPDAAIPRYGAVLQVMAAHAGGRAALEALLARDAHVEAVAAILERIYRAERDAAGLARIYERRLAAGSPGGDRRADWAALADVHEALAGDPVAAFGVWSRAIAAMPDDDDLLAPLLRLADGHGLWSELAARLDQLLQEPLPPDVEQVYAMRLGEIAEDHLAPPNLEAAAQAYERAAAAIDPRAALAALDRVLARSGRWPELAGVLRREADACDDDAPRADLLFRLGDLAEATLHDAAAAVAAYREVLAISPAHAGARAALERMLTAAPAHRAEIVDILEPLFDQDGDAARLVGVLEARLAGTEDPVDRAGLLARIAELAEHRLGDRGRALDAALRWLAVDPASAQALNETDRLAERLGQWPEVGARLVAIVDAPEAADRDPDTQVVLLTFLGRIQRKRLGQLELAAGSYRRALAVATADPGAAMMALDDLIKILRQQGDEPALADALRQRGRAIGELTEKRAAFAEVAQLCERAGDRAGAIAAWREYLDADDTDRGVLDELARLYRAAGERAELIDVLSRAAELGGAADDEKRLRVEIAQLEDGSPRAVAAWQAVVDLDPDDLAALTALEHAYARASDWIAVADIQTRRLHLASSTWDKVAIHAEMAELAEHKRGSADDAIAAWFAALDVDPSHQPAYDNLERLLAAAGRHHDLVDLLERSAEVAATRGDGAAELAALARAADVWEGPLDNPDAAGEILEKILAREPGSVAALTRLSKIYERAGDWDRCKATLEQALGLSPTGRDAADLFYRLAEVARVGDADPDTAVLHLQQALKHDPSHAQAIVALEQLARDRRDHALLADMLQRRVATVQAPAARVELLVEIAELERKAGRVDAALEALTRAAAGLPDDIRVLAPLGDLYFAAGRYDDAAPIYDRLAAEAKAQRRMKDVARYRQRQGGILEARGDTKGALASYEEALRVNPTDITTMCGLGKLYFAAGDWEKARRIYQSLVLQNIDPDAGVTKGEVYWALGTIHLQLGQPPRAKTMFQRGLELEPHNDKLKQALSQIG